MSKVVSVFDKEALELLFQMRNLLDEVLETMDILADGELMKAIRDFFADHQSKNSSLKEVRGSLENVRLREFSHNIGFMILSTHNTSQTPTVNIPSQSSETPALPPLSRVPS
jgi:hypothetical protein